MKRISKWLVPKLLIRLDEYLLENHIAIWRSRLHYVVFYGIIGSVLLFLIGFCYPVKYDALPVPPVQPISIIRERSYRIVSILLLMGIVIWGRNLYQKGKYPTETLFLFQLFFACYIGLCLLFGLTAISFRMGTLVRTAYFLDDPQEAHIQKIIDNNYYRFGFVYLEQDTLLPERMDTNRLKAFFSARQDTFIKITHVEDSLLNLTYQKEFLRVLIKDLSSLSLLFYHSDRNELSYLLDLHATKAVKLWGPSLFGFSFFWFPKQSEQSEQLHQTYRSDIKDFVDRSDLLYLSYRSFRLDLKDLSDLSNRPHLPFPSNPSDLKDIRRLSDLSDWRQLPNLYTSDLIGLVSQIGLDNLRALMHKPLPNIAIADFRYMYNLEEYTKFYKKTTSLDKNILDSLRIHIPFKYWNPMNIDSAFNIPVTAYHLEKYIRSIQHARRYFRDRVIFYYWIHMLWTLPLFTLLLLSTPYFDLIRIAVGLFITLLSYVITFPNVESMLYSRWLPLVSGIFLFLQWWSRRKFLESYAFHLLFLGILATLILALFRVDISILNIFNIYPFFSTQILGILGLWLMVQIAYFPKWR